MSEKLDEVKRPWGSYAILRKDSSCWVKKIFVNKGARLSLQSHEHRSEVWYVLSGKITVWLGNQRHEASEGEFVYVPKKTKHRIEGITKACVLEVAFGRVLERDIVRYEDDYGRAEDAS